MGIGPAPNEAKIDLENMWFYGDATHTLSVHEKNAFMWAFNQIRPKAGRYGTVISIAAETATLIEKERFMGEEEAESPIFALGGLAAVCSKRKGKWPPVLIDHQDTRPWLPLTEALSERDKDLFLVGFEIAGSQSEEPLAASKIGKEVRDRIQDARHGVLNPRSHELLEGLLSKTSNEPAIALAFLANVCARNQQAYNS